MVAMSFAYKVAEAVEREGHHARIVLKCGCVRVDWLTHKMRGLHRNEFIMAAKTDELYSTVRRD